MKYFFKKSYRWAIVFTFLLIGSFAYVMLDTFVMPKSYQAVVPEVAAHSEMEENSDNTSQSETNLNSASEINESIMESTHTTDVTDTSSEPVITDYSYEDANIKINIETVYEYDSNIYIADIQLTDASYLQTALAKDTYGRNIKDTTSEIAEDHNAIFAINGDYYGFRDYGYVLRNGVLYRDSASDEDALVINNKGDFSILEEDENLDSLDLSSIWQMLSFGPALMEDGEIVVDNNSEVGRAMSSNPRTAIGQISDLHYIIVVSDGRTEESEGLSLKQLAQVFSDRNCEVAYNLDGGGSSTMYFNGEIVNVPTDGRNVGEREVSDIVYIGY